MGGDHVTALATSATSVLPRVAPESEVGVRMGKRTRQFRHGPPSRMARAFTLVELLIVIGIIAVLISILMPAIGKAREEAKKTACQSNLRTLGQAMFMYANGNRERLPNGNPPLVYTDYNGANRVMVDFNNEFVKSPRVFWCPSDRDPAPEQIVTADALLPNSARGSYE